MIHACASCMYCACVHFVSVCMKYKTLWPKQQLCITYTHACVQARACVWYVHVYVYTSEERVNEALVAHHSLRIVPLSVSFEV